MNMFQTFEEFLATSQVQIPVLSFIINLVLAAALALILGRIYVSYGTSLSNRKLFGRNFLLTTMTTMLIISIVKSSLALSLGLVGALSIIRFRAAIKEPEELSYLFLAIGIGLGFGANQGVITVIAFIIIAAIIILIRRFSYKVDEDQNLHLTIDSHNPKKMEVEQIVEILKKYCSVINLKRLDETDKVLKISFLVEFDDFKKLNKAKKTLQSLDDSLNIAFLDTKGIF